MVTEEDKQELIQAFENAKTSYEMILTKVNRISKDIDLMDESVIKPLKKKGKCFGLTLITGGLPIEMVELKMRLDFTIKHLDKYITDIKNMKVEP
jgi:hypothetical protein